MLIYPLVSINEWDYLMSHVFISRKLKTEETNENVNLRWRMTNSKML